MNRCAFSLPTIVAVLGILFGLFAMQRAAHADPAKYPAFAQQTLPAHIKPALIKIEELVAEIKAGAKPLLVDVRTAEEFREAHILGAASAPLAEFKDNLKSMPRDRPIVLY
jgi:3-mercaptopyruvate sulfurtransferase SseA